MWGVVFHCLGGFLSLYLIAPYTVIKVVQTNPCRKVLMVLESSRPVTANTLLTFLTTLFHSKSAPQDVPCWSQIITVIKVVQTNPCRKVLMVLESSRPVTANTLLTFLTTLFHTQSSSRN